VKARVPTSPLSPVMWFATLGAPIAWGLQFGIGYWITQGRCGATTWNLSLRTWAIVLTAAAAVVAVAAGLTALALFRRTNDVEKDDPPPLGRVHFFAIVGMAITPLFVAIIVMNGVGVAVLEVCHQS
jgi:heme/copper-type cytochrome/quinol oxidase subunit 2